MNAYTFRLASLIALLLLPVALAADIDTPHYRVEVIVFSHAEGRPDARTAQSLKDFSALVDPLRRARVASAPQVRDATETVPREDVDAVEIPEDEVRSRSDQQAEVDAVLELFDTLSGLEEGALMPELPTWPEPWLALDSLSPKMERARARLQDSSRYEVRAWRAWHQPLGGGRPGEQVRIHDEHVVAADWVEISPTGTPGRMMTDADSSKVEPAFHYRLDGSVRLRQRQFMHIESDLHWRVPARPAPSPWPGTITMGQTEGNAGYEVHRLAQSRTVRPGRLEYFDSAWLGMLVFIEPLEPLDGSDIDIDDIIPADD